MSIISQGPITSITANEPYYNYIAVMIGKISGQHVRLYLYMNAHIINYAYILELEIKVTR